MVWYVVQIAGGIGMFLVDCRRKNLIAQGQDADAGFKPPRTPQKMPSHRFCGTDRNFLRPLAEDVLKSHRFNAVSHRCGSAVGIHVTNVVWRDLCVLDRSQRTAVTAIAPSAGCVMW